MEIEKLFEKSRMFVESVSTKNVRYLYKEIDWSARMICIKGARGTGKTTLMGQRMLLCGKDLSKQLYVTLDDFFFTDNRLLDVAEYAYKYGIEVLYIDEVHKYPYKNWIQELKNIYDTYNTLQIIFSGSSLLSINMGTADLSRRCLFYNLSGLSLREYIEFEYGEKYDPISLDDILNNHEEIERGIVSKLKILPIYEKYLRYGYYPMYKEGLKSYHLRLQQIINVILENDLPMAEKIETSSVLKLKKLLNFIANSVPFMVNLTKVGEILGVPRQSVTKLLDTLDRAALLTMLQAGKSNFNQLKRPEKIYLDNANLMYAFNTNPNEGTIRETFVANSLKQAHQIASIEKGDFLVDDIITIEVGGDYKTYKQISDIPNSYLVIDGIEYGHGNRIPIWLFGFLY